MLLKTFSYTNLHVTKYLYKIFFAMEKHSVFKIVSHILFLIVIKHITITNSMCLESFTSTFHFNVGYLFYIINNTEQLVTIVINYIVQLLTFIVSFIYTLYKSLIIIFTLLCYFTIYFLNVWILLSVNVCILFIDIIDMFFNGLLFAYLTSDYAAIVRVWAVVLTMIAFDKNFSFLYPLEQLILKFVAAVAWLYFIVLFFIVFLPDMFSNFLNHYEVLMIPEQNMYWFHKDSGLGGYGAGPDPWFQPPNPGNLSHTSDEEEEEEQEDQDESCGVLTKYNPNEQNAFKDITNVYWGVSDNLNKYICLVDFQHQLYVKKSRSFSFDFKGIMIDNNRIINHKSSEHTWEIIGKYNNNVLMLYDKPGQGLIYFDNRIDVNNQIVPLTNVYTLFDGKNIKPASWKSTIVNGTRISFHELYKLPTYNTLTHPFAPNLFHKHNLDSSSNTGKLFIGDVDQEVMYKVKFKNMTETVITKLNSKGQAEYVGRIKEYPFGAGVIYRPSTAVKDIAIDYVASNSQLSLSAKVQYMDYIRKEMNWDKESHKGIKYPWFKDIHLNSDNPLMSILQGRHHVFYIKDLNQGEVSVLTKYPQTQDMAVDRRVYKDVPMKSWDLNGLRKGWQDVKNIKSFLENSNR